MHTNVYLFFLAKMTSKNITEDEARRRVFIISPYSGSTRLLDKP
jgi:hypothetical protein